MPQFTLWKMENGSRVREARTRLRPIGEGLLEIAVYERRDSGAFELRWSMAYLTADRVNDLALSAQREHEADGWTSICAKCSGAGWTCEAHPDRPLEHQLVESSRTCNGAGKPCGCEIGQRLVASLDETFRDT